MKRKFKVFKYKIAAVLSLVMITAQSQTSIGGIVNIYTPVTAIDFTSCPTKISVLSSSGFAPGDKVLIIQMKGAQMDSTNTSSFGTLIGLNGAGHYEIARISSVTGNVIRLNGVLNTQSNPFVISGKIQLIKIPAYANANVTSVLGCQAWNGKTGGVLILEVTGNLALQANIDVSGKGFRGGNISKNPDGSWGNGSLGYSYPLYQSSFPWVVGGALKGEGISDIDTSRIAGRGPLLNGGGGGNKHNNGGGGGSNYTAGGKGGFALQGCPTSAGGVGGNPLALYYSGPPLFMGGGGGSGDQNDFVGSSGENGGGIVIIMTGTLTGNNFKIRANGNSVIPVGFGIADGAGGGGGGGAVFIKSGSVTTLTIEANGGDGGKQSPYYGCVGPGGGGGTGVILTTLPSFGNSVTTFLQPGAAGYVFNTNFTCNNTTYGAMAGQSNATGVLVNRTISLVPDSCSLVNSIDDLRSDVGMRLLIFPDPASSFISWKNETGHKITMVKIYDCTGKMVIMEEKEIMYGASGKLDISDLANGVYILEIAGQNKIQRGRFVKAD